MPRKKSNIHYIYKTTCLVTNKYYIGMHSTSNLEDGYMGSGKKIRASIRKHGKENHKREILEFFASKELLIEGEKKAITSEMLSDKMCMNLMSGGTGWNVYHNKAFVDKLKNDSNFRENYTTKMSIVNKISYQQFESRKNFMCNWNGRNHSDKTKQKMSEKKKGMGSGEMNSQYGTCWITNGTENKKIQKEDKQKYFLLGWVNGRSFIT